MLGQPFDQRQFQQPNNIPNTNPQLNPSQRVAMSYPPNTDLQNNLHIVHQQQSVHQKEPPQIPQVPLYQGPQIRGSIPGQMPTGQLRDQVGGPYMQVYNYGTEHHIDKRQQSMNQGQYGGQQNQNSQDQDPQAHQQQVLLFWEHKFFTIFQRFQIIHEKVEWMRTQFYNLNNQLKAVDSQNEWNMAKQHHDDYMEQIQQFSQELAGVLNQNIALYEQQQRDNDQSGIWKQRYYQLFQSYKNLQMQAAQLRQTRQASANPQHDQQQVNQIIEAYRELERQYTGVMNELTELKQSSNDNEQLLRYRQKLDYTLTEAQKYKQILQKLHEQNQQMNTQIYELKQQNERLKNHPKGSDYGSRSQQDNNLLYQLQNKDAQINHISEQYNGLQQEYEKMMQQREQNEGYLYNQTQLLEREVEKKTRQCEIKVKQLQVKTRQIEDKNRQLRQGDLMKLKIQDLQAKNKSLLSKIEDHDRIIRNINNELDDKNDEIRQKINQTKQKANQIQKLKISLNSLQNRTRNNSERDLLRKQYQLRVKNLQNQYDSKISTLKKTIKQKQQDSEINALTIIKLETLEKKNKTLLRQIQKLSIELVDKDKQLYDLRRSHYETQKTKQIQNHYNSIIDQKQSLSANLLQKNLQIDNLQNKLNEFEERIRELGDKSMSNNSKTLIVQIQELNNIIHGKEAEIIKLKSSINLKQQFITELQSDIQKYRKKLQSRQIQFEKEKSMLFHKNKDFERRNQDLQKKIRQLEFDYGTQMKKSLQQEIRSLRNQNQAKQQEVIRLQVNQMELQSRIAHFERIRGTVNTDMEDLASRIRQMESSKIQMIKKVQSSYRDVKRKDKQIKDYIQNEKFLKMTISDMENQLRETEDMAKEKQKIIDDLQSQLMVINTRLSYLTDEHEKLRMRRRDQTDIFIKESDELKRKLYQTEMVSSKPSDQNNSNLNEKIKRLEQQKQFLRNELASALEQIGQVPHFKSDGPQSSSKSRFSKGAQGIDYIQKRLFEFNSKIDGIIKKNKKLDMNSNLDKEQFRKTYKSQSQDNQQIRILKQEIQSLRKYCAKLQIQANGQTIRPNPKYSMIFIEQEKAMSDRCNFYKKQSDDLEQRITKLLQINNHLKERVDSLLKGEGKYNLSQLYNEQVNVAENKIEILQKKIQKLIEQNRSLKANNEQRNMKMCREYEDQIFECENKIFDLQRKIVTLEVQKSKSESIRLTLNRNYNTNKSTLQTTSKKLAKHQKQNAQLTKQIQSLENEASEILSKLRIIQSENSRLNQALQSSFSQQHILLNTPHKSPIRS